MHFAALFTRVWPFQLFVVASREYFCRGIQGRKQRPSAPLGRVGGFRRVPAREVHALILKIAHHVDFNF